jgi:hypothetical protein
MRQKFKLAACESMKGDKGICGLRADSPLTTPGAHDCIAFFPDSHEKYRDYFNAHRGSFFMSAGSDLDGGWDGADFLAALPVSAIRRFVSDDKNVKAGRADL